MPKSHNKHHDELRSLTLNVSGEWFAEVNAGIKTHEYREQSPHWITRLYDHDNSPKQFKDIQYKHGYPAAGNLDKTRTFPWQGFEAAMLVHRRWDYVPTPVFAIKLQDRNENLDIELPDNAQGYIATADLASENIKWFGEADSPQAAFDQLLSSGEFNDYCDTKNYPDGTIVEVGIFAVIYKGSPEWDSEVEDENLAWSRREHVDTRYVTYEV